jgi:NAD-dependent SIR2 family protein deacetylase
VAVLCGAGISRNSCQPIVAELEEEVLATLRVPNDEQRLILESCHPFEAFIELMRFLGPMENIYAIFDLAEPNVNHRVLTHIIKLGKVCTVVTTYFDALLESGREAVDMHPGTDCDLRYLEDH